MSRHGISVFLLAGLCTALFFSNLGGYDLWSPDEPRYAEVARNMMASGEPLRLVVNGAPYREKPPLFFWAIAGASWPFGDVSAGTARFPSAVAGLLTVLLTYAFANRLYGPRVALWAGVILATNMRFWWQTRWAQIDMVLTLFMVIALMALWLWETSRKDRWLLLFFAAISAGLLAKGPPALLFPLLTIFAFYWPYPETRKRTHWLLGSIAASVPVLVWLWVSSAATASPAHTEAGANLFRQTIGRALLGVSKASPPWEYLLTLPQDLFPWTLVLPWAIWWAWRHRKEDEQTRFLLCWIVPAFIVFSLMIGKRAIYLLPLIPVISIVMGRSLVALLDGPHAVWRQRTMGALAGLLVLAGVLIGAAYFAVPAYRATWVVGAPVLMGLSIVLGVASGVLARRDEGRLLPGMLAGSFAALAVAGAYTAMPAMNIHKSTAYITAPVRELVRSGASIDIYSVGFSREGYTFYSEQDHIERFTGLVPFEAELTLLEKLRLQKQLADAMADAAIDVPIGDLAELSDAEAAALLAAIEETVIAKGLDDEMAVALREALQRDLDAFAVEFGGGGPAFLYAQEQDWRWVLALTPAARDWPVIDHRAVGSRSVLLVANEAGLGMLQGAG